MLSHSGNKSKNIQKYVRIMYNVRKIIKLIRILYLKMYSLAINRMQMKPILKYSTYSFKIYRSITF